MKRDVRFKMMPNGNIRAFKANTRDLAGASEWMITSPTNPADSLTTVHIPKIYIKIEQ